MDRVMSLEFGVLSDTNNDAQKSVIKSFTDLECWKHAHILTLKIYACTKHFPSDERMGLTSQIRRAVVSIESNLAEGFGRRTPSDRLHFYDMARGSLYEVKTQIMIALDLGYIKNDIYDDIEVGSITTHKLLTGLINSTRRQKL
jgi:four helix bundle protein